MCYLNRCLLGIVSACAALECSVWSQEDWNPPLSFDITPESEVLLSWPAAPDVALQRSTSLIGDSWETLGGSLGLGELSELRSESMAYYRLARLSATSLLETRLTKLTVNQLRRAIDPAALSQITSETPPTALESATPHSIDSETGAMLPYAWATQPGLIRIYNGNPDGFTRAYKLYSSANSVLSSATEFQDEIGLTANWQTQPHRFVDLNARDADGNFPILDPRAQVEGFETPDTESLPMPVEWLYVLNDGSLGTLDEQGDWQGDGTLSETNPITARMAYWTDDETSKLNINVASEGIPWDMPRCDTPQERNYALDQPLRGEVQRHPGHPAQTSLSSILFPGKAASHPNPNKRLTKEELAIIYNLTPRVTERPEGWTEILPFDDDPIHENVASWQAKAKASGITETNQLSGFVTTNNASPETSIHGRPRISLWPISESGSEIFGSPYDDEVEQVATIRPGRDQSKYVTQRRASTSALSEFYTRANRANVDLFRLIIGQSYLSIPGYRGSLAQKYGARLSEQDYQSNTDYDKDHYAIALSMFDRIRGTNLDDPHASQSYADLDEDTFGQVAPISLIDRDLVRGTGSPDHVSRWNRPTLEPLSTGRRLTFSEIGLIAYVTAEATLESWSPFTSQLRWKDQCGVPSDQRVMNAIVSNQLPIYNDIVGQFTAEDVGKTFQMLEVALLPEAFSPSQGYPRLHPHQNARLYTGGQGYLDGLDPAIGLRINGIPLQAEAWGDDASNLTGGNGFTGPVISTADSGSFLRGDLRDVWLPLGGHSGVDIFRFGQFTINPDALDRQALANGVGPLSLWYSQLLVFKEADEPLKIEQDAAIQIIHYGSTFGPIGVNAIRQVFNVRLTSPGTPLLLPTPIKGQDARFWGWTRRINPLQSNGNTEALLEPTGKESVTSLAVSHGDYRHVAMKRNVPSELFTIHSKATEQRNAHSLQWSGRGGAYVEHGATYGPDIHGRSIVDGADYADDILPDFTANPAERETYAPLLGPNYHFPIDPSITRDFDNGMGNLPDGAYINKADEGEDVVPGHSEENPLTPYFDFGDSFKYSSVAPAYHVPHRMAPSAVSFGSIPSAAQANAPWTCLLFRPNVSDPTQFPHLGETGHGMLFENNRQTLEEFQVPQMASVKGDPTLPPDHLWLDYFWMPTVEPSHVTTPFATQGKVNLNYQLFPFTDIKRAAALHAVLKAEEILAIPTTAGQTYKSQQDNPNWRHRIDAAETLKQFDEKFAQGHAFVTASEICEQFLIPEGETWDTNGASIRAFWDAHRLSGDNTLERPYAGLYGRVTTQSNVFRLHFRIQEITMPTNSEEPVIVNSDTQGSKILERVLDHHHPDIPNYIREHDDPANLPRLERFYEFREN